MTNDGGKDKLEAIFGGAFHFNNFKVERIYKDSNGFPKHIFLVLVYLKKYEMINMDFISKINEVCFDNSAICYFIREN